ncbi:MAG: selenoneine synthase SenA [Acidimicrobiia bacterium]
MIDPAWLAGCVVDARDRAVALQADLSDEQLTGPLLEVINPLAWELGHVAWFQELFVLRRAGSDEPLLAGTDSLFDSGAVPHDTRWHLALPSRARIVAYLDEVTKRVVDRVTGPAGSDVVHHFTLYTVFHYDWHAEAVTYTRQTLGYPAPTFCSRPTGLTESAGPVRGRLEDDVEVPGSTLLLGASRAMPFAYDNEKWAHPVTVAPFAMARSCVTEDQFRHFVDDGGYRRPELWDRQGRAWRDRAGAQHPVYWRPVGGDWERRHFDEWSALGRDRPVVHVNWYEADAFARWAGRRLPTEAEWELVATGGPGAHRLDRKPRFPWGDDEPTPAQANVGWSRAGPVDAGSFGGGDDGDGCRHLIGNVWEWTATTFEPYPNFEPDAYRENSEQFFGSRKVLRGGSWASPARLLRTTLRNYFTPERRDVFAGFRTCAPSG